MIKELGQRCGLCDAVTFHIDHHMESVHAIRREKLTILKDAVQNVILKKQKENESEKDLQGYEKWLKGKCIFRLKLSKCHIEPIYTTCRICDEKVIHDKDKISRHLLLRHDMSTEAYYYKFVGNLEKRKGRNRSEVKQSSHDRMKSHKDALVNEQGQGPPDKDPSSLAQMGPLALMHPTVYNLPSVGIITNSTFVSNSENRKGRNRSEVTQSSHDLMKSHVGALVKEQGQGMPEEDSNSLAQTGLLDLMHQAVYDLPSVGSITNSTFVSNLEKRRDRNRPEVKQSSHDLIHGKHDNEQGHGSPEEASNSLGQTELLDLPHQTVYDLPSLGIITASTVIRKICDACQFVCPYCQAPLKSTSDANTHIRTKHKGRPNTIGLIMENAKELRYYECHLCKHTVMADIKEIAYHARNEHKMGMARFRMLEGQGQVMD